MNNINIKSNMTRNLNIMRYIPITCVDDQLAAMTYAALINRQTKSFDRLRLKQKLAMLYDARLEINVQAIDNIICIRYTVSHILEQYLPTSINNQAQELLDDALATNEFTIDEFNHICKQSQIALEHLYDNKQKLANMKMKQAIDGSGLEVSKEQMQQYYQSADYQKFCDWCKQLASAEVSNLDINNGKYNVQQKHTKLKYERHEYKQSDEQIIDMQLDQAYLAIAYQIDSPKRGVSAIANMVFGGDVYSRLFKIVREQLSLSYNIRSKCVDKTLITVSGGVNRQQIEQALAEIDKQLKHLQTKGFKEEFELAKTNMIARLKTSENLSSYHLESYNTNYVKGETITHEQALQIVDDVRYEDVAAVFTSFKKINVTIVH